MPIKDGQLTFNLQQLKRGINSDSMKLRDTKARVNEEGEYTASYADLERLTQNSREELPRIKQRPSEGDTGWSQDQYYGQQQAQASDMAPPPPSYDPNQYLPEKVSGYVDPPPQYVPPSATEQAEPSDIAQYDNSGLMAKLAEIQSIAKAQGKSVHLNTTTDLGEYHAVFRYVMNAMIEATGMRTDYQGDNRVIGYWVSPEGVHTGFNRIHTSDPNSLGLSLMDPDNPNAEDDLVSIPYGSSVEEFQEASETFLCNLYAKHLGIQL